MSSYADTGFVCSLYAPDANTAAAEAWMKRQRPPLLLTALHRLEFRNALRLRVFRKEVTSEQREFSIQAILSDLAESVFIFADLDWPNVFLEAERLSATHSEMLGTRSLDILHVACALLLGADEFVSFDQRQIAMATAAGLNVPQV